MDLMLNCAFGISYSNGTPFVEYIRINNKEKGNSKYAFEFNDREIKHHPIVQDNLRSKLKKSKTKKEEVYITLEGEELQSYYDLKDQVFKFNERILKSEDGETSNYDVKIKPAYFISQFELKNKKVDNVSKISKLMQLIPSTYHSEFKAKLSLSYEEFTKYFISFFDAKHLAYAKELFVFFDNSDLNKLIDKKSNISPTLTNLQTFMMLYFRFRSF